MRGILKIIPTWNILSTCSRNFSLAKITTFTAYYSISLTGSHTTWVCPSNTLARCCHHTCRVRRLDTSTLPSRQMDCGTDSRTSTRSTPWWDGSRNISGTPYQASQADNGVTIGIPPLTLLWGYTRIALSVYIMYTALNLPSLIFAL